MEVIKITANNNGDHFLALDQELKVKKQNEDGTKVWVDGIQKGTKIKIIEQIIQSGEFQVIK